MATSQFDHQFVAISSSHELKANASGWGISGSLRDAGQSRYLAYRAFQITGIDEVDDRTEPRAVSPDAAYYVRRIFYGRMVEFLCTGTRTSFTAGVRADFGVAGGSIGGFEKRHSTKCRVNGKGLKATDPAEALFATDADHLRSAYTIIETEHPVPILVEYRRVPGSTFKRYEEYEWQPDASGTPQVTTAMVRVDPQNDDWQSTGVTLEPGDVAAIIPQAASVKIVVARSAATRPPAEPPSPGADAGGST